MPPKLIVEGKIQILDQTVNSGVYAVATDSKTGWAKDSPSVLKGGSVWYEGREALGPGKDLDETDERARKEAAIYELLGNHERILGYLGLEEAVLNGAGAGPRPGPGGLRDSIMSATKPPTARTRLALAVQFAEGVAHIHRAGIVWGDLSTRNAVLFDTDKWRIKLCDFADSDLMTNYPSDWYGCEVRYCPPGSGNPHHHDTGALKREVFALGTALYEITEWKVPYGPQTEVAEDQVLAALASCEWPAMSSDNPASNIIRQCWGYGYGQSRQVVDGLRVLL
ncbi:kinase-like domain-containing protein [Parachaetomium inaequale]|uniref:Kinase-like domain-containing protein n=1 Tax=Parachaetomium inaequale TaxID=2588326 RepID=A0AAN6PJW5_9PEZI|nr:kinase-like domain-containing protein [Parachaetomium inaequale]